MRITEIWAEVQWSEAVKNGDAWKKVCLGRKAVLESGDNYVKAHQVPYDQLVDDLKAKFASGDPAGNPGEPASRPIEPTRTKAKKTNKKNSKPKTKMCPIHRVKMKLFTNKNGGSWYSHNDETTGGEWCNGKKGKK